MHIFFTRIVFQGLSCVKIAPYFEGHFGKIQLHITRSENNIVYVNIIA